MELNLRKGQSAIEYLTTYGWMLLVIAVVGGALFTTVRNSSQVQSTSGLANADVQVEDFGVSEDGGLEMSLLGAAGDQLENVELNISDPETGETVSTSDDVTIPVGETETVNLDDVEGSENSNTYDVEIEYDAGGLEGLTTEGTVTGRLELNSSSDGSTSNIDFQLSGVSDNGSVTEGETLGVDYTVNNNGGASGSQDVSLDVSGVQEDVDSSVSLSSSGSSSGTLTWVTESGDAGSGISYTVFTSNDSVGGSVDVNGLTGPTASASDNVSQPEAGDTVKFIGSDSTEGDGSITGYSWDVDGDSNYEYSGSGPNVTHSYSGSGTRSVVLNVTDSNGLSSTDSLTVDVQSGSVSVSGAPSFSTAPSGAEYEDSWVPVSSDSGVSNGFSYFFDESGDEGYYNVSEGFYVMKYEAKPYNNVSNSFDSSTGKVGHNTDYVPRSVAANKPWRDISFNEGSPDTGYGAVQACEALDGQTDEFDVHLVTNREWMTVARQIEQTDSNWVGGSVDSSGQLIRGHSDGSEPYNASTDDSDGFYRLGSGEDSDYNERTFDLANGEVVWDWAGNVWHWLYAEDSGGSATNGVFDTDNPGGLEYEKDPAVVDRSTSGVGTDYGFYSGNAALRGGLFDDGASAGVFNAGSFTPYISNWQYGFRCSAVPVS